MLDSSKIRFIFKDGSQKEISIHGCLKGIKKNGQRPVSACIYLYEAVLFDKFKELCNDVFIALRVGSEFDDVKVFGIVPQERMNG